MKRPLSSKKKIELSARVGEEVRLELDENPTTGFRWLVESECPEVEVASDFDAPSTSALGAGGRRTFKFRVRRPGRYEVTLNHRQPWEPLHNINQQKKVILKVTAR